MKFILRYGHKLRIRDIKISSWRNFENLKLNLEEDTGLVCIVGANGTGKSHLLEPELHLNADLVRAWVSYLKGTVKTGQIWIATHSLEAVEVAGQTATFVLERDDLADSVTEFLDADLRGNEPEHVPVQNHSKNSLRPGRMSVII